MINLTVCSLLEIVQCIKLKAIVLLNRVFGKTWRVKSTMLNAKRYRFVKHEELIKIAFHKIPNFFLLCVEISIFSD